MRPVCNWPLSRKQSQARTDHFLHRIHDRPQNPIWHYLVGVSGQTVVQRAPPCDPKLGVDVNDVDSGSDGRAKVFIFRPRSTMQRQEYRTRLIADVVTGKLDVREAAARLPDEGDRFEPDEGLGDLTEEVDEADDSALEEAMAEAETTTAS